MSKRPNSGSGFTLVECLVVLAVIAVLVAIFLPVFRIVREKSRQASCLSNLKQIGLALQQYTHDNEGKFPRHVPGQPWHVVAESYIKSSEILRCPSQTYPDIPTTYYYNFMRLTNFQKGVINNSDQTGVHEAALPNLADIIALEDMFGSDFPTLAAPVPSDCKFTILGRPATGYSGSTVHSQGGNYLFADGHVKWLNPQAKANAECSTGPYLPPYS